MFFIVCSSEIKSPFFRSVVEICYSCLHSMHCYALWNEMGEVILHDPENPNKYKMVKFDKAWKTIIPRKLLCVETLYIMQLKNNSFIIRIQKASSILGRKRKIHNEFWVMLFLLFFPSHVISHIGMRLIQGQTHEIQIIMKIEMAWNLKRGQSRIKLQAASWLHRFYHKNNNIKYNFLKPYKILHIH